VGHELIDRQTIVFGGAQAIVRLPRGFVVGSDPRKKNGGRLLTREVLMTPP
jgi:gamma-glutamyltranspeptidase